MRDAVEKAKRRHARKLAKKKHPAREKVPAGCGMGWSETKDRIAAMEATSPEYSPNHDGRIWPIV